MQKVKLLMNTFQMKSIGVIHTPYKGKNDIPIQGIFKPGGEGYIELKEQYVDGLSDLNGFSHAFLIYYFHKSKAEHLQGTPYLENEMHGIFSIRSPHRPNHLGLSVVRILRIDGNRVYIAEVDMLDGTPLLDIKPYVKYFDCREEVVSGWLDKHFIDGHIPDSTILTNKERLMKVAISTDNGYVSAHFGRCPEFTIFEIVDNTVINRVVIPNPGHHPGFLPEFFQQQNVNAVIAGGGGQRAQSLFQGKDIEFILGVTGPIDSVIDQLCKGELDGGESLCQPGAGKGYGVEKDECDHDDEEHHH